MKKFLFLLMLITLSYSLFKFEYLDTINGSENNDTKEFKKPSAVYYKDGYLYVSDDSLDAIYIFNQTNDSLKRIKIITSESEKPFSPGRMYYDEGFYIIDKKGKTILIYSGTGYLVEKWIDKTNLKDPKGIVVGKDYIYITDSENGLYLFSIKNKFFDRFGIEKGMGDGKILTAEDIAYYQGRFFITDIEKNEVIIYSQNLTYEYTIGRGIGGVILKRPKAIEIKEGLVYVLDSGNKRVVVFSLDGYPLAILNVLNASDLTDLAIGENRLYLTDSYKKQIKIYKIEKENTSEIDEKFAKVNQSIQETLNLKEEAAKLNITVYDNLKERLEQATDYYKNFQYRNLYSALDELYNDSENLKIEIQNKTKDKIEKIIESSNRTILELKEQNDTQLNIKLDLLKSKISAILSYLSNKNYPEAIRTTIFFQQDLAKTLEYLKGLETQTNKTNQTKNQSQDEISSLMQRFETLILRFESLKEKYQKYKQYENFTEYSKLFSLINESLKNKETDKVNIYFLTLEEKINNSENSIKQKIEKIDEAMKKVSLIEEEFQIYLSKKMLIGPDLEKEKKAFESAKELLYSDPEKSIQTLEEILERTKAKIKDSENLTLLATSLIILFAIIALSLLGFYFYIKGRKKKKL
jgi:hypothetical protein